MSHVKNMPHIKRSSGDFKQQYTENDFKSALDRYLKSKGSAYKKMDFLMKFVMFSHLMVLFCVSFYFIGFLIALSSDNYISGIGSFWPIYFCLFFFLILSFILMDMSKKYLREFNDLSQIKYTPKLSQFKERYIPMNQIVPSIISPIGAVVLIAMGLKSDDYWIMSIILFMALLIMAIPVMSLKTLVVKKDEIIFHHGPRFLFEISKIFGIHLRKEVIISVTPKILPRGHLMLPAMGIGRDGISYVQTAVLIHYKGNNVKLITTSKPLDVMALFVQQNKKWRRS